MTADAEATRRLWSDACARLAADTLRARNLPCSLRGLAAYESMTWADRDDEAAWASVMLELAAVTAAVAASVLEDAQWVSSAGIVPFALAGFVARGGVRERIVVDAFGSAEFRFRTYANPGPSAALAEQLSVATDVPRPFAAYEALTGAPVSPSEIEARALRGRSDDRAARAMAETLARSLVDDLRAWGMSVGGEVRWEEKPGREVDLCLWRECTRPLEAMYWLASDAKRAAVPATDGHRAMGDLFAPYTRILDKAMRASTGRDKTRPAHSRLPRPPSSGSACRRARRHSSGSSFATCPIPTRSSSPCGRRGTSSNGSTKPASRSSSCVTKCRDRMPRTRAPGAAKECPSPDADRSDPSRTARA